MLFFRKKFGANENPKETIKMLTPNQIIEQNGLDRIENFEPETKASVDKFEKIASDVLDREIVMNSPIDGTPIGVIRTEDVLNIVADRLGVNIERTDYSQFKN